MKWNSKGVRKMKVGGDLTDFYSHGNNYNTFALQQETNLILFYHHKGLWVELKWAGSVEVVADTKKGERKGYGMNNLLSCEIKVFTILVNFLYSFTNIRGGLDGHGQDCLSKMLSISAIHCPFNAYENRLDERPSFHFAFVKSNNHIGYSSYEDPICLNNAPTRIAKASVTFRHCQTGDQRTSPPISTITALQIKLVMEVSIILFAIA